MLVRRLALLTTSAAAFALPAAGADAAVYCVAKRHPKLGVSPTPKTPPAPAPGGGAPGTGQPGGSAGGTVPPPSADRRAPKLTKLTLTRSNRLLRKV